MKKYFEPTILKDCKVNGHDIRWFTGLTESDSAVSHYNADSYFWIPDVDEQSVHFAFEERFREICDCLEHKLLSSALALALTLPDICGLAEFGDRHEVSMRYTSWFERYIGLNHVVREYDCSDHDVLVKLHESYCCYLNEFWEGKRKSFLSWPDFCKENGATSNGFCGEALYALRCSFLHTSDALVHVNKTLSGNLKSRQYRFIFTERGKGDSDNYLPSEFVDRLNGKILCCLDAECLCMCLVHAASDYFMNNRDKFSFTKTLHFKIDTNLDFDLLLFPYDTYVKTDMKTMLVQWFTESNFSDDSFDFDVLRIDDEFAISIKFEKCDAHMLASLKTYLLFCGYCRNVLIADAYVHI